MFFGAILPIESIGISTGMATGASSVVPSATMYGLFLHMKPEGRERNHPMTDEAKVLVERLRWGEWYFEDPFDGKAYASDDPLEAADLIETQAREIERLREAVGILEDGLQEVGDDYPGSSCQEWCQHQIKQARAALAGDSHD